MLRERRSARGGVSAFVANEERRPGALARFVENERTHRQALARFVKNHRLRQEAIASSVMNDGTHRSAIGAFIVSGAERPEALAAFIVDPPRLEARRNDRVLRRTDAAETHSRPVEFRAESLRQGGKPPDLDAAPRAGHESRRHEETAADDEAGAQGRRGRRRPRPPAPAHSLHLVRASHRPGGIPRVAAHRQDHCVPARVEVPDLLSVRSGIAKAARRTRPDGPARSNGRRLALTR